MVRKTKSKERLDRFYQMAKEQGYRSRAAFKLIQLNAKHRFLSNCRVLVDLCAAPGGWLQVAERFMPLGTTKIGIDLDPIPRIAGVKTFQEDITTQKCVDLLKKELQGQKADVFLNDGAPNVGANWSKDALTQNQLVLSALKLASTFLREGGFFVTKVFRSTDFNSLKWVLNKFFEKVIVTKPQASRNQSAETFVVCEGYLAPTFIDEKLFDPTLVFKDTEADHQHEQRNKEITSMDKLMENNRSRGGYDDDAPQHLYREITLEPFILADNPFPIFKEYNKMTITEEEREKYVSLVKTPPFCEELMSDLKVLGKGDVSVLLKWRAKIRQALDKQAPKQAKKTKAAKELGSDEELERQLIQEQRRQMKNLRKEKEKEDDQLLLSKGVIGNEHHHDEQFGEGLQEALQGGDLEDLGYEEPSDEEEQQEDPVQRGWAGNEQLEEDLEAMYEKRKERIQHKTKQIEKVRAEKKNKRQAEEVSEDKLKAGRINSKEQLAQQLMQNKLRTVKAKQIATQLKFSNPLVDNDSDIYISDEERERDDDIEVDPDERVPGEREDDDAYVIHKPLSDMERRRKMLNRKKRKEERTTNAGEKKESEIELVPAKKMEDYDIDSLAETLAVAKKMLRNRTREQIIDASYSRYTFEDHDQLPSWFTDDEKKHNYKIMPITKEEYQRQKNRLLAINARAPKKVLQAKIRKRMKLSRKMKKVQQRAQKVLDQDGIDEYHKMKQVNKLYARELASGKTDKKYVVGKAWKGVGGKPGRNIKYVDSRLKKDKRATKRIRKTDHKRRRNTKRARF